MGVVNIQKTYGSSAGDALKFLDGSMTAFICPKDIDEIYNYTFYNYGATLRYVEIGENINFIGHYAFYGCNGVYSWKIPNNLLAIGQYAFCNTYSQLYSNIKVALDFNSGTSNYTIVRGHAFQQSFLLESINGNLRDVGENAFDIGHVSLLSSMHIKIQGSVGNSAFRYMRSSPENFSLDKDSNITSIGQEAFSRWDVAGVNSGYLFDLRNSTFTQMPYGVFSHICPMSVFYLPTSVSTINNSVFSYTSNCVYYFSSQTPPTIATETFYNNTSTTIFVPYNNINAYKTATYWTTMAQYIKGWAPENTFSVGETLPTVNQEGYGLTWYTDRECTTQISVVVDADVELYCVASAGSVVDPVFENNDWSTIRQVVRMGIADQYWNVGDTKQITLTDSSVVTYRIADMQSGRYALADGSGYSNMVLEPVGILAYTYMNTASANSGGFATSSLRTELNSGTYNRFPQDVRDAMSEVVVLSGTGDGTTTGVSSSNNHLFIAAETEMFASNTYSIGTEEDAYGLFDYYSTHTSASDRIKTDSGVAKNYYLRSPMSGNNTFFCRVSTSGNIGFSNPVDIIGHAPLFAI